VQLDSVCDVMLELINMLSYVGLFCSKRELEAEKQEARKLRMQSAKIASSSAQPFNQLPVFSPPKKVAFSNFMLAFVD
jgi:hypothetical protein